MIVSFLFLSLFLQEPPTNTALIQHPKVIVTPHLGASTIEAQERVACEIAEQFVDVVNGKSLFGAVSLKFVFSSEYSYSKKKFFWN